MYSIRFTNTEMWISLSDFDNRKFTQWNITKYAKELLTDKGLNEDREANDKYLKSKLDYLATIVDLDTLIEEPKPYNPELTKT